MKPSGRPGPPRLPWRPVTPAKPPEGAVKPTEPTMPAEAAVAAVSPLPSRPGESAVKPTEPTQPAVAAVGPLSPCQPTEPASDPRRAGADPGSARWRGNGLAPRRVLALVHGRDRGTRACCPAPPPSARARPSTRTSVRQSRRPVHSEGTSDGMVHVTSTKSGAEPASASSSPGDSANNGHYQTHFDITVTETPRSRPRLDAASAGRARRVEGAALLRRRYPRTERALAKRAAPSGSAS